MHRLYQFVSPYFRRKRIGWFLRLLQVRSAERVLDIGGCPWFWTGNARSNPTTLFNLSFATGVAQDYPGFTYATGDACALPFAKGAFDVVFSNSVIEHTGTWERQKLFAGEARRVGGKLWVQTPAREFFIEPHLVAPFIHRLPARWQRRLIRNFTPWGWVNRPASSQVDAFLAEVRLLTGAEMRELFPDCDILEEKFLGMTKSYIAVRTA